MTISEYNIDSNFWVANPSIRFISPFKELYKSDKGKGNSSKIMWSIASYVDISQANVLYNLSNEDKISIIEADYMNGKFDIVKYKELISKMSDLLLSKEYRALRNLSEKLDERTKLIADTAYTMENALNLDKLISGTEALINAIKKMEESISSGNSDGDVKGGRKESLSERGEI